jgi:hypothetical protein
MVHGQVFRIITWTPQIESYPPPPVRHIGARWAPLCVLSPKCLHQYPVLYTITTPNITLRDTNTDSVHLESNYLHANKTTKKCIQFL